jgi:hypothetical protein
MKTFNLVVVALFITLLTTGCAKMSDEPTTVMLQNPETMEFVKCDVDQWGTKKSFADNQACVEDYKSKGYVIWAER